MNEQSVLRPIVGVEKFDTDVLRVTHSADDGCIKFEGHNVADMNREDLLYVIAQMHDAMAGATRAEEMMAIPEEALEWPADTKLRLYRVNLRGFAADNAYSSPLVVAPDPTAAYKKVRRWLDHADYGFDKDREMLSIELLAEDYHFTGTASRLFL